jgi:hypothetical protein
MSDERVRRPEASRTQPIRHWGALFGAPPAPGARPDVAPDPADPVVQGVATGYRVIDDYLQRGQSAARSFWTPWAGAGAPGDDPASVLSRFAMAWSEVASTLMMGVPGAGPVPPERAAGAAGPFTANAPPAPRTSPGVPLAPGVYVSHDGPSAPPARAPSPAGAANPRVALEVTTRRTVSVTADLRACPGELVAHDLRLPGEGPRIGGVTVASSPDGDRVIVRLAVPDDAAPGTYVGAVIEAATGLPCGTLAVRVEP